MLFGKKKEKGVPVMHYEGIDAFATDYPVNLVVDDENIVITRRVKPETTVTLPLNRVKSFTAMEESRFMQQYKGNSATTSKSGIAKYYLVVNYDKGNLVFWGTAKEYRYFLDLQSKSSGTESHIEL